MPHSNFKERSHTLSSGVRKCSCGQTFDYASEREMNLRMRMHRKFCSNPSKGFNRVRVPKKARTMKEIYNNQAERIKKVLH